MANESGTMELTGELITIAVVDILENPVALRSVNTESEEFAGLVESMKQRGFFGAITVRPKQVLVTVDGEPEEKGGAPTGRKEKKWELLDGLQRTTAARKAGLTHINANVRTIKDAEALELQLMANFHRVATRPVEYSQQLKRILAMNPLMTEAELAAKLGVGVVFINQRLGLTKIDNEEIKKLINTGKIGLSNAYALAKLPSEEQPGFIQEAMTMAPKQFGAHVNKRVKEIKEARAAGTDPGAATFTPQPHIRTTKDIMSELDANNIGPLLISENKVGKPADAFRLGLLWAINMDPKSQAAQVAENESKVKEREHTKSEAKIKRAAEKAEKDKQKAEESAAAAVAAQEATVTA